MPYTSIPTLSDGSILTSSHLNLLADNCNYLLGLGGLPALAFPHLNTSTGGDYYYHIRHRHRYLHLYAVHTGTTDFFKVYYNGTLIHNDGAPSGSDNLSLDTNSLGLTVGTWYTVRIEMGFFGGTSTDLGLIWESPAA